MKLDLSISVVSYNTKDLLERCLTSIFKETRGIKFETIVVDNGSTDGSSEMVKRKFPGIKLIKNNKNLFFAKANNQALKIAKGKYFLILNSDAYFVDNSLKKMVNFLNLNSKVGAIEGLELYENKEVLPTGSKFSTPLIDFYELSLIGTRIAKKETISDYRMISEDRRKNFEIEVGCDAFLMIRKKLMEDLGGYDEKFLLFYTENDLCLRIKREGYKIIHFSGAKVLHTVSASTKNIGWKKTDIYYNDLLNYYKKNGQFLSGTLLYYLLKFEEVILKIKN